MPFYSGDGQNAGNRRPVSPFVPLYSGDGQGKVASTGDGQGSAPSEPMPVWSGGGRHDDVLNPMMPTWGNTNGRFSHRVSEPVVGNQNMSAPRSSDRGPMPQVPLSDELVMNVNVQATKKTAESKPKGPKGSGTWKLIALVVVFLVWVSTASTLLFLYMDRYLFP